MTGCLGILFLLAIIVFGGAILVQNSPILGMIIVAIFIITICIVTYNNPTNNPTNNISNTSTSSSKSNPIIPHMYRKQIRRYFRR
jgi:ABC-type bacteriocin/lantibiotic exporter with double-glycine peptidase domain